MTCAAKNPVTGVKYVEYQAEDRNVDGCWGVLLAEAGPPVLPIFKWLGLATEFIPPHKEIYEETAYLGASDETHTLELQRNTNVGSELTASLKYIMQDWAFIEYITGAMTGFSDTVDSVSVVTYLNDVTVDKWTVLTGGMLTKWAMSVPVDGLATVDVDFVFADADILTSTDPIGVAGGVHASELATAPYTWKGITLLKMDTNDPPTTVFTDIVGDIGLAITSDVEMSKGVDSLYMSKGSGVTINSRKVEVSLDLTYTSPNLATFQSYVEDHDKLNLSFHLGNYTVLVKGLLFPEWVAELKPGELVGQTVTAITDLPSLTLTAD
ncbi:hypothetical protein KAW18_18350 [candidate division WOR-3 bacterium]|nr:hypothetical protein [candidate division WOR-3 bacterium]